MECKKKKFDRKLNAILNDKDPKLESFTFTFSNEDI